MKLPLFSAAFKNQWVSMVIYCMVLFLYGALITLAFTSMITGMINDPSATAEGLTVTKLGEDDLGNEVLNLTWETEAGVSYHTAFGVRNLSTMEPLMDEDIVQRLISGELNISEVPGLEVLYNGTGTTVEFSNRNGSTVFAVLLVPSNGNPMDMDLRGPVYTADLMKSSDIDEFIKDNPMMKAFFGERMVDYTSLEGFITVEYFSMWPLFFVIYIAMKTSTSVSKHVEDRSMDVLLGTGYSRNRFLTEKLLVIFVNVVVLVLSAWSGVVLGALIIGETPPLTGVSLNFLGSIPLCLAFIGISLLLSVLIDEGGKAIGAVLGVIIFQYILLIVANIATWGTTLKYFSLFSYWDSMELGLDHVVDPVDMMVPTVLGAALIVVSYVIFNKKEIHA